MNSHARIRIAFVNHTAELGGGELALLALVRNLDRSRFAPVVILFNDGPLVSLLQESAAVHILVLSAAVLKAKKDRLGLMSLFQAAPLIAAFSLLVRLHQLLRSLQPHLVYTNSLKADILGGVAGRLAGLPVVWHVRDRIAPDYLPSKIVSLFRRLARFIPTFIIANSASTLSSLHLPGLTCETGPACCARVIHDGVDPAFYETQPLAPARILDTERLRIGLIGRISPWKGQDIFLRAVRLIHQNFPDARFQIIGAATFGEIEYEQRVRRLQLDLGLSEIVEWTGFEPDIPARLQQLDIVVHASTLPEPFGQVIIEGMAAGRPVIATDGGGVPEIMLPGKTGLVVPMRDSRALGNAMSQLLGSAALRASMGTAGQQHIRTNFTIQRTARAVEAVSEQILGRNRVRLPA